MSDATSTPKFSCPKCQREFAWRPQIAGKNAKCKCGATVHVPEEMPPMDVPELLDDGGPDYGVAPDVHALEQSAHHRCPSCGQAMQPGTVLCMSCGFNMKTGQRMHTAIGGDDAAGIPPMIPGMPKAAPAAPENRFGVPGGIRTPVMQKEEGNQLAAFIKPAIILGVLLVVVVGAIVGVKMLSTSKSDAVTHEVDKEYLKYSDFGEHEMKEWVTSDPNMHMIQGMNDRQAIAFADKLYGMGAVKVVAFGGQLALKAGVELPKEPDKRKALFEWQANYHREQAIPVQVDEGQKYMVLNLKMVR
jgi:predicted RNA-binding Zn-ribbon protein involved in translation (DUF1610 family)